MEPIIKITCIPGLKEIALSELRLLPDISIVPVLTEKNDAVYVTLDSNFEHITQLKSVLNAFVVLRDTKLNPYYIFKHKSMLGELIEFVRNKTSVPFKTFNVSCAGEKSQEVKKIIEYVADTYKLCLADDADMEIYIGTLRSSGMWELGVRLTVRPLSARSYRIANIHGGLNATIAYAMNVLARVRDVHSYLNVFSGSGTLLIEAGQINTSLVMNGFDVNGKTVAEAVKNIKKARMIERISLVRADIFDTPRFEIGELGKFDVITSDLPFGMQVSKGEDLSVLYERFVTYCEDMLNRDGKLVAITSEYELLAQKLSTSKFNITQIIELKIPTSVGAYLYPRIFVCQFR